MHEVVVFVEDAGHEQFLKYLLRRLARQYRISLHIRPISVRGGSGRAMKELRGYVHAMEGGEEAIPDLLIVAVDANCRGLPQRRTEVEDVVAKYTPFLVCAIPDPHIERWLLLDSTAFKQVLGIGCKEPDQKCERDRYKRMLEGAIRAAGREPVIGGLEFTEDIVNAMRLEKLERTPDLGALLKELRQKFQEWARR